MVIALLFFRKEWKKVYVIFLLTMLVDLDHVIASPIFQANRCSIGFHPLHSFYAIAGYMILLFFRKPFNILGIGLSLHMSTDLIDCLIMFNTCQECYIDAPAYKVLVFISDLIIP